MLTTIVLTKNSEKEIEKCLHTLRFSDEILVIDDDSSDKTVAFAKKLGARIITHSLANDFAKQRNFALEHAKGDWVLFVDSDEVVSDALASEIESRIKRPFRPESGNQEVSENGYFVQRRDYMWGKEIFHGENGSTLLLRLAKKDAGRWEGKVHEVWQIKGNVGLLGNTLHHYPHPTLTEFLTDINRYTTIRAEELYTKGVRTSWYHVLLYPKAKFVQNYIIKMGFLDGTIGFILAMLMSLHSFLVRGKLWQLQKNN